MTIVCGGMALTTLVFRTPTERAAPKESVVAANSAA